MWFVIWVHIAVICTVHTESQKKDSGEEGLCKCDWCTVLWVHVTAIWVRSKPLWGRRPLSSLPVFLYPSMIGQLIPLLHRLFSEATEASFILIDKNRTGLSRKIALVRIIKKSNKFPLWNQVLQTETQGAGVEREQITWNKWPTFLVWSFLEFCFGIAQNLFWNVKWLPKIPWLFGKEIWALNSTLLGIFKSKYFME